MEAAARNRGEIQFYLTVRPAMYGQSDVVLRLYRSGQLASETVVSTVRDDKARMVMLMCRMQLFRQGYHEHVITLPHVNQFQIEQA